MKKKVLSVLLAGVFVLGTLTGCGKDNSQSDSSQADAKSDSKVITIAEIGRAHV